MDGRTPKRDRPPETAAPRPNGTHMHHYQAQRKNYKIVWHGYAAVWISFENKKIGQKEVSLTDSQSQLARERELGRNMEAKNRQL